MNPTLKLWLNRLATFGLIMGVLLLSAPFVMRAYGQWHQTNITRNYERPAHEELPAAVPGQWEPFRLQVPTAGVDFVVVKAEGDLKWIPSPAHEPATAMPGQRGNCVIAGHRNMWDYPFIFLSDLREYDYVYLTTRTHKHTYRVEWSREVGTNETEHLRPTKEPALTLYTCTEPFKASRRWVVRAALIQSEPV
jgi:LPXTG-site transpeptidase (sortase) family protein